MIYQFTYRKGYRMDKACKYLMAIGYKVVAYNNPKPYVCEISHTDLERPIVFHSWNDLQMYVDGMKDFCTIHGLRTPEVID